MPKGVQYSAHKGHQADEEDVGKHDNQQFKNKCPFFLHLEDSWNDKERPLAQQDNATQDNNKCRGYDVEKDKCLFSATFFDMFGKNGDESGAKGAFAKEAPKQVWYLKSNGKGIPYHACTKNAGAYHITCKTKYAA